MFQLSGFYYRPSKISSLNPSFYEVSEAPSVGRSPKGSGRRDPGFWEGCLGLRVLVQRFTGLGQSKTGLLRGSTYDGWSKLPFLVLLREPFEPACRDVRISVRNGISFFRV